MAFLFARAAALDPPGLVLTAAEARRQRASSAARSEAARAVLSDWLAARRPGR